MPDEKILCLYLNRAIGVLRVSKETNDVDPGDFF